MNIDEKTRYFANSEELKKSLNKKLEQITTSLYEQYNGKALATVVLAIIGQNEALIANVGDSKAFIVNKEGKLEQVSKTQTGAQVLRDLGEIPDDDEAQRFHHTNNLPTGYVGYGTDFIGNWIRYGVPGYRNAWQPYYTTVNNNNYKMVLLCSDGVTDCLSQERIGIITKNTSPKDVARVIVSQALNTDSKKPERFKTNPYYITEIKGGKDNTSITVFANEDDEIE